MSKMIPAPIIVQPSGQFDGNSGLWSSFYIRVGNPAQAVRVLVSTQVTETWVVLSGGCTLSSPADCPSSRGGLFSTQASNTWSNIGNYLLNAEVNLGYTQNFDAGDYGYDTLGVSTPNSGGISLDHQPIAAIDTPDFYVGTLGISPANFQLNQTFQQSSFLSSLRANNLIPSLSWSYTAGALYQANTTASLTLGGYDSTRFVPNDVSFTFGTSGKNLTVGIQQIQFTDSSVSNQNLLLGGGIYALIDSTVPDMWLPTAACTAFEKAFGIQYNEIHQYYLVNDTQHAALLKQNASVTFLVGNSDTDGPAVKIVMPYAAFDLQIGPPLLSPTQRYFPLRQANDPSQYTLGRTFLQEAFLTVDYERGNFSVSQCVFPPPSTPFIRTIYPVGTQSGSGTGTSPSGTSTASGSSSPNASGAITITQSSSGISGGAIAGIVVAVIVIAALLGGAFFLRRYRRKQKSKESSELDGDRPPPDAVEMPGEKFRNSSGFPPPKYTANSRIAEVEGNTPAMQTPPTYPQSSTGFVIESGPAELGGQARSEMESPEPKSPKGPTRHQTSTSVDTTASGYPTQGDLASVASTTPLPSPEYEITPQFGHTPRDSAFQSPLILPQTSSRHKAQNPSDASSLVSPEAPSPGAQFPSPINSPDPETHLMDPIHNYMNNLNNR